MQNFSKCAKLNNYLILAEDFLLRNEPLRAIEAYNKALSFSEQYKEKVNVLFELADLYSALEMYTDAFDCYSQIADIDEHAAGAWFGKAFSGEQIGIEQSEVIKCYQTAVENRAEYHEAYYYLGHAYYRDANIDEAIKNINIALEIDKNLRYFIDLSSFLEEKGSLNQALEVCKEGLEIFENEGELLFNSGVIYRKLDMWDDAFYAYIKSLNDWDNPDTYLNISVLFIEKQKYDSAIEWLKKGISVHFDRVTLHYNLACSYAKLNKFTLAANAIEQACSYDIRALDWAMEDKDLIELLKMF